MKTVKRFFELIKPEIFKNVKTIKRFSLAESFTPKTKQQPITENKAKEFLEEKEIVEFNIDHQERLNIHFNDGIFITINYTEVNNG